MQCLPVPLSVWAHTADRAAPIQLPALSQQAGLWGCTAWQPAGECLQPQTSLQPQTGPLSSGNAAPLSQGKLGQLEFGKTTFTTVS